MRYRTCEDGLNVCRITIGYHRLYSHRAFHASLGVRIVLAILGSIAFQGSIKVCKFHLLSNQLDSDVIDSGGLQFLFYLHL